MRTREDRLRHFGGDCCNIRRIAESLEYKVPSLKELKQTTAELLDELGLKDYKTETTSRKGDEYGIRFV